MEMPAWPFPLKPTGNALIVSFPAMKRHVHRRCRERIRCAALVRIVDDETRLAEGKLIELSDSGARLELPYASCIKDQFFFTFQGEELNVGSRSSSEMAIRSASISWGHTR